MTVLNLAHMQADTTHIKVYGPQGNREKVERFPIADVRSDKVFLAYAVNGEKLPQKHGFPLRIVAEDYYGDDWVKYVYKIEAIKKLE
jgi:sulfoxide reductase catalytic subunit YedY